MPTLPPAPKPQVISSRAFQIGYTSQGVTSIQRVHDRYNTDYVASERAVGSLVLRYRTLGASEWNRASAAIAINGHKDTLTYTIGTSLPVSVPVNDLKATEQFRLVGDALIWTISLRNATDRKLEIGDLGLPLPFNTHYGADTSETYTKRLIRHSFVAGGGSFIYWMRTNAQGPYLVMTPGAGTSLEYFDEPPHGAYTPYIHSEAAGEDLRAKGGTWRQPQTHLVLAPQGKPGDARTYSFKFQWAPDYAGVRNVLYREGLADINVVPGMTVPTDLSAMFSLRTQVKPVPVTAEHPDKTKVEYLGERGKDIHVYRVRFAQLGENRLTVSLGGKRSLPLEFFTTEPLETLYKKRAAYLVSHEQHRDPTKWYNGLFSQWDMKHQILRSPDDLDGLWSYAVASDDTTLGKSGYVAEKNVFYPNQTEIERVEYYIKNFVWGGLQQTDKEPYPYAIYGIPNWKVLRDGPDTNDGTKHIWRIYDYPHVIAMYYSMSQVARNYPNRTKYLDADGYLERAFGTAKAFFTVPMEIAQWSPYETGTYNEVVIPNLIQSLDAAGHRDQADWLRSEWEKKVEFFVNKHPYLYGSEYSFDSTGFESTQAFARYATDRVTPNGVKKTDFQTSVKYSDAKAFLSEQMRLNIACRGWLETSYYYLGSDYRGGGSASYTLSYMAQMGGWSIIDYALNDASDPIPYLRLGYASYLSSWALLNTGTEASNYGYWYPGKNNDGGASGGFEPRPWGRAWLGNKEMGRGPWWYSGEIDLGFSGALRTAATIVVQDPIFGLFAYGGDLSQQGEEILVIPKDGLRTRFDVVLGSNRLQLSTDRDGFAQGRPITFDSQLRKIAFTLENRDGPPHDATLSVRGLPAGAYSVSTGNLPGVRLTVHAGETARIIIPVAANLTSVVVRHL
ncbi:MAG: DUF5695 domain-containing protein [Capsulimonas sp.]|uniref:DUF5695 domain-containing protein n=1 Tax=Capsulimonas sp. TaxID=2494211 RepID=UPI0032651330